MGEYISKVKRHFTFSSDEMRDLGVAILVAAFLFGFDDGAPTFVFSHWLFNYIYVLIIVALVFIIHESVHKLWALGNGYKSEFKLWPYGIAIGIIGAFISNGKFFFLALGGTWLTEMAVHRIGRFRYGLNKSLSTWIAFSGPLVSLLLAFIFKPIYIATGSEAIGLFVKVNLWYAVFSMLPIPPLDGSTGFFGSRSTFILMLGFAIGAAIMIWIANSILIMLVGALVFALITWFIYYLVIEKEA